MHFFLIWKANIVQSEVVNANKGNGDFTPLLWKTKPDLTRCVHVVNYSHSSRMNKAFLFWGFVLFLPLLRDFTVGLCYWNKNQVSNQCWEKTLMTVCLNFWFFFPTQSGNQSAEHLEMKTLTHLNPLPTFFNLFLLNSRFSTFFLPSAQTLAPCLFVTAHISPVQFGAVSLTEIFELTRELISDSHHGVDERRFIPTILTPSRRVLSCF